MFRLEQDLLSLSLEGASTINITSSLRAAYSTTLLVEQEVSRNVGVLTDYTASHFRRQFSSSCKGAPGCWAAACSYRAWSWPLTSIWCRSYEWVALYLHFVICLLGVHLDCFTFYLCPSNCVNLDETNKAIKYQNTASWQRPSIWNSYEMTRGGARQEPLARPYRECSPAQFFKVVDGVLVNLCWFMDAVSVAVGTLWQGRYCSPHPQNPKFQNTDFVDKMISNVLRDLPINGWWRIH